MGAKALQKMSFSQNNGTKKVLASLPATSSATPVVRPTIQRAMKFEFQTKNRIFRNDGVSPPRLLDRKYGPNDFLHKGDTGVRLESETGGVLEFETEWFRKWSGLEKQIREAFEMTQQMNAAPDVDGGRKKFPFDVDHLKKGSRRELRKGIWERKKGFENKNEKILAAGEKLEVEIRDSTWEAGIQSSESFLLGRPVNVLERSPMSGRPSASIWARPQNKLLRY